MRDFAHTLEPISFSFCNSNASHRTGINVTVAMETPAVTGRCALCGVLSLIAGFQCVWPDKVGSAIKAAFSVHVSVN